MDTHTYDSLYRTINYQWSKKPPPPPSQKSLYGDFYNLQRLRQTASIDGFNQFMKDSFKVATTPTQGTEAKDDPQNYVYKT